jgi:hypothetical protein
MRFDDCLNDIVLSWVIDTTQVERNSDDGGE